MIDELLLSKVRLAIVAELLLTEWVPFTALAGAIDATPGNLGTHLGKLVAARYVEERKSFVSRRPSTRYRITETGKAALIRHVDWLRDIVRPLGAERAKQTKHSA